MSFSTFRQFENWLAEKGMFHIDLSLERIRKALSGLSFCPAIQVMGTNGKGSTSAFLASIAEAHGLRTGLYTSPHFVSVKERILINGREIEDSKWLAAANQLLAVAPELTYFESLTVLAVMLFASCKVDLAIYEAGLGGRHDATTAIPAAIQCYTQIGMDHVKVIGPGLTEIAQDKAGAMRAGAHVFSAPQYNAVAALLAKRAKEVGATLEFAIPLPDDARLGLRGAFQYINAGVAAAAWRKFADISDLDVNLHGLESAFIPGRMQEVTLDRLRLILDGGHNPHAIQTMLASLPEQPDAVVFSALSDKNWHDCLAMLLRLDCPVLIPQLVNDRAANATEMASWANMVRPDSASSCHCLKEAIERLDSGLVLVCGSLYLLAEFFTIYPQYLQKDE